MSSKGPGTATSKVPRRASRPQTFQPFYEAVTVRLPGPSSLLWKVGVSAGLGVATLIPLLATVGKGIFRDWLWLVCAMITVGMLSLYYATDTLQGLFPHMDSRLHRRGKPFSRGKQNYYRTVRNMLRDRNFVLVGIFFGIVNCAMGFLFGVSVVGYSLWDRIAIFIAFFVVGFVCGMATLGGYGVLETVKDFIRAPQLELDDTAPDGCGGMRFLGEALVKFGSLTLFMGVLIAIFIMNFKWVRSDNFVVSGFRWFWIAWPFALSLLVVLASSAEISGVLSNYKVKRQDELDERLAEERARANDWSLQPSDRETARKEYEYYSKQRETVYSMSTWPFGFGSSIKYVSVFITNAGALAMGGAKTMIDNFLKGLFTV